MAVEEQAIEMSADIVQASYSHQLPMNVTNLLVDTHSTAKWLPGKFPLFIT